MHATSTTEPTIADMKAAILDLVTDLGGSVSFAEIVRRLPGAAGDNALGIAGNIILWHGLSSNTVDAIRELNGEGAIVLKRTSVLTYLIDGSTSSLPVVGKHLPKAGYVKERWMPTSIDLGSARPSP